MESQNPATEPDDKATIAESKEITFNAKAFDVFFQRVTTQASEGGAPSTLRRRSVDVIVDHELCRLGTFVAPIKLTLRELDSATELRVLRSLGAISQPGVDDEEDDDSADDAGQAMAMGLGKASIYALNGRPLQDFEKDLLWGSSRAWVVEWSLEAHL